MFPCNLSDMLRIVILVLIFRSVSCSETLNCEVCVEVLRKFGEKLSDSTRSHPVLIENEFKKFCSQSRNKEKRFCYYVGGLEDSATSILRDLSTPLSWYMPPDKICGKLKKKDSQICELRYDMKIDLANTDINKLKVKDLKKILHSWGEVCHACIEKSDFVRKINEVKPIHLN